MGVQIAILLTLAAWMIADPRVTSTIDQWTGHSAATAPTMSSELVVGSLTLATALILLGLAMAATSLWPLVYAHRFSVRYAMWCCLLIAVLCGLVVQRSKVAWLGYQWRATAHVTKLDSLALSLDQNWPSEDGEIEALGPFTSYPFDRPSVLLLLSPYPLESTQTVVAAVERTEEGSLLFQLGGKDVGVWLHWSRDGRMPREHTSGLSEQRSPDRFVSLNDQWHVVRYLDS